MKKLIVFFSVVIITLLLTYGGGSSDSDLAPIQSWRIDTVSSYGDTIILANLGFINIARFTITPDVSCYISYTGNYTNTTTIPVRVGETYTLPEWFDVRARPKLYIKTISTTPDTIRTQIYGK